MVSYMEDRPTRDRRHDGTWAGGRESGTNTSLGVADKGWEEATHKVVHRKPKVGSKHEDQEVGLEDATTFRAVGAPLNSLSQDRPVFRCTSTKLCSGLQKMEKGLNHSSLAGHA